MEKEFILGMFIGICLTQQSQKKISRANQLPVLVASSVSLRSVRLSD